LKTILNLTQHSATPEQIAAGVVDLTGWQREELARLLTFDSLPGEDELTERAKRIAALASGHSTASAAMIGGAPYLMAPLQYWLERHGITPVYAYSVRASEEQTQADGSVRKVNVFRHAGFVEAVSS
jgi:hypothetical protein